MSSSHDLFAACAPGLEPLLAEEIEAVLGRPTPPTAGGVELEGSIEDVVQLNLRLGLASQVLVRLTTFTAKQFSQLERKLGAVDWGRWIDPGTPLVVRVSAKRSRLYHTKAIEERVRRVVQERLRADSPSGDPETAAVLHVRMSNDVCTVSIDSSGAPLHRRGYRLATAKAPLREDLARAVVRLSGWDGKVAFADPFCGSGTLGIEAALLARGRAPGLGRGFAFERWPGFDPGSLARARADAEASAQARAPGPIWLSDRDAGAVRAAQDNAERAGVLEDLEVAEAPMGRAPFLEAAPSQGCWVSNPPHGRRIGDRKGLTKLHQSLGRRFEGLGAGWRLTVVVRDRRLAFGTGLTLEPRLMTESGGSKIWVLASDPGGVHGG